jgi:hypothetical protein
MSHNGVRVLCSLLLAAFVLSPFLWPQEKKAEQVDQEIEALKKLAVKVYIDCGSCDLEYIKTEITFVNYVRDRKEADVHVLITTQATGSGGREYTLSFLGQNGYSDVKDIQKYYTEKTATDDEVRQGLVKALKLGLLSYVGRTPISSRLAVNYKPAPKTGPVVDRWKSWVFSLSGSGYFSGEKSYSYYSFGGSFSANRVTQAMKLNLSGSWRRSEDTFQYEGTEIKSRRDNSSLSGLYVFSLGEHWSAGAYVSAQSSTYSNLDLALSFAPAIEYNVFPYSQSTRRQLRLLYRASLNPTRYREETLYAKMRETLWKESLSASLELREKWGTVSASLSGAHYFHDLKKYNVELFGIVQLNLYKGLSIYVIGSGARIHDQIYLPKGSLTKEEVLLQLKQLQTTYSYFAAFGVSFTFGSIYTNVINPRFGSSGGSGVHIEID